MNILQICHKVPYPPKDGGCIAINNLTNGLIDQGHRVKVLAINTKKHYTDISSLPEDYRSRTKIEAVDVDTEVKPIDAFLNLFTGESYNISRFSSNAFGKKIEAVLKSDSYDIVQLESLYTSPYTELVRKVSKAKIVLRSHNVEFMLWERNKQQSSGLKRAYLELLTQRLKAYEVSILNKYDGIAAITPEDGKVFRELGCKVPLIHIPFGVNAGDYPVTGIKEKISLFHIGAMDWEPNILAMEWLLENVWDALSEKFPSLELHLAGRNMPQHLKGSNKRNVVVQGEVKDAKAFMSGYSVMIAPIFTGGGMRTKIIEAMAVGKVVITTRIGIEGITAENNKHVLLAEDKQQYIDAVSRCMNDKALLETIGTNARKLVEEQYDNKAICHRLATFYRELQAQ